MRTLRARILAGLLPVSAVALLATGVAIDRAVHRDLIAGLDERVLTLTDGIGGMLVVEPGGELALDEAPDALHALRDGGTGSFYTVRSASGEVLYGSGGAPSLPLPASRQSSACETVRSPGVPELRVCTASIRVPHARTTSTATPAPPAGAASRFWIQVGLPTAGVSAAMATLCLWLAAGLGGLFVVLAAYPVWLVGRCLAPLRRLSGQAAMIGPHGPRTRLQEGGIDGEILDLVSALNRTLDRHAEALERQKRFTADAAHELRSPMSVIRTECEVALRKPREAGDMRDSVEAIHRTSLRLSGLLERLLTLSRHDAALVGPSREEMDLTRAAREAASLHTGAAASKGIVLTIDLPRPIPVTGDRLLLGECIANLVDNAVRFTQPGGSVRVTAGEDPSPWVAVEDNGPGIPEEDLPRVFDRFYRGDPARARDDGGSGLGLAIAQEIARLHGAQIRVASAPGRGSRFELVITPRAA